MTLSLEEEVIAYTLFIFTLTLNIGIFSCKWLISTHCTSQCLIKEFLIWQFKTNKMSHRAKDTKIVDGTYTKHSRDPFPLRSSIKLQGEIKCHGHSGVDRFIGWLCNPFQYVIPVEIRPTTSSYRWDSNIWALKELQWKLETTYPETTFIVAGDCNKGNLRKTPPTFYQHIHCL